MGLLISCLVTVWTDSSQKGWKKKTSFWLDRVPICFQSPLDYLHDKVWGKGCSHILAATETKEASIQFISSLVLSYHLYHCQFNWDKGSLLLRKKGFCPSQGKSTHPQISLHWLPFHRGFYSWEPPAQVTPLHQPCRGKILLFFPPNFSGLDGWSDAFGKHQSSHT